MDWFLVAETQCWWADGDGGRRRRWWRRRRNYRECNYKEICDVYIIGELTIRYTIIQIQACMVYWIRTKHLIVTIELYAWAPIRGWINVYSREVYRHVFEGGGYDEGEGGFGPMKSCRNKNKEEYYQCFDLKNQLNLVTGIVSDPISQTRLDGCTTWGPQWVPDYVHDCSHIKSCRNKRPEENLKCVDETNFLTQKEGLIPNDIKTTDGNLQECESWTGEGGEWAPDYLNVCATPKSCKNRNSHYNLQCVDVDHYYKKDSGIVINGGETQTSLNACTDWTSDGGEWTEDYLNDCTTPKSCRNTLGSFNLQCVDAKHYLKRDSGIINNGGETQESLKGCSDWTSDGGQWVPDYLNECAAPKSCRNKLSPFNLQCVDVNHHLKKDSGIVINGGETQASLDACIKDWTSDGGQWFHNYFYDCAGSARVKSCRNRLSTYDLQCVDVDHYLHSGSIVINGGETQEKLNECNYWTSDGGAWYQDWENDCSGNSPDWQ